MATSTSWVVFSLLLLQFSSTLFNFSQFKLAHANELCTSSSGNVTNAFEEGMKLYPLINGEKVKKMMVMNETRRKLGSFQICAPCTCCGAKDVARAQLTPIERGEMSQDEAQAIVYHEKMKEYQTEKQRLKKTPAPPPKKQRPNPPKKGGPPLKKPKKEPQTVGSSGSEEPSTVPPSVPPTVPPPSQEPIPVTDSPVRDEPPFSLAGQSVRQVVDPLAGMDAAVRANITEETEEAVRNSGKRPMAEPEVDSVPLYAKFSSKDRTKIYTDMYKAVPKEYRQSLPGFEEGQIGQMQAMAADLFIRCEGMKAWKRGLTKQYEQLRKENDSNKEFYHHEREQLQVKMQLTIESQQSELFKKEQAAYALAESHQKLQNHNSKLEKERDEAVKKAEEAEGRRTKEVADLSDKLARMHIEVGNKELAVKRAYEKAFPDADYEWFERRLKWAEAAVAAETAGQPVPELEESEEEAEEEEDEGEDAAAGDDAA